MTDPVKLSRGVRLESGKMRSERFDRVFVPLTRYRPRPAFDACRDSAALDEQSKERLAELRKSGIAGRFQDALEARELLYHRSFPELAYRGSNIVLWHALCDLCADAGRCERPQELPEDVRVYARHYRFVRVRDVLRAEREG